MKFIIQALIAASLVSMASLAAAQQEVRLKSGGVLLGSATIDGDHAVVQVGEAAMRVPLAEVAEISATVKAEEPQPQRLLRTALEAKILNDADKEVVGLLAEAARLSPEDPQIAFWYATSLVDAGYGQAAQEALEKNLAAVRMAYPGAADRLAARIKRRVEIDKLPPDLVERLDELTTGAGAGRTNDGNREQVPYYSVFRVIDQHGTPLSMTQNSIQGGGNNERLEAFPDGYYLFSYLNYPGNTLQPSRLIINQPGVRQQDSELPVSASVYSTPHEVKVHRFGEGDKRQVKVRVIGHDGKPIPAAEVTLQPMTMQGGYSENIITAQCNAEGIAAASAFPGQYQLRATAQNYLDAGRVVQVKVDEGDKTTHELMLHSLINADISVGWLWTPIQGGESASGDVTVPWSGSANTMQDGRLPFYMLRFDQIRNDLFLLFNGRPMDGRGGHQSSGVELRWLPLEGNQDANAETDSMKKAFDAVSLDALDKWEPKLKPVPVMPGRPAVRAAIKLGKIYIGKFNANDPQTGQMGELTFKVLVESNDSSAD
jgi:hypothetical protein